MASVGNFPGVYPTITDLSQVVTANSVTSCAYVGEAEFGPINKPILITNKKGYIERFGEIKSKYGYMGYSLAVASDSIGQHYIVRVVNEETAPVVQEIFELYSKDWGYQKIATYLNKKGIPTPSQSRGFVNAAFLPVNIL